MNLPTAKQRVKAAAALALIHDNGHDALAVQRGAQADINRGLSYKASYERAFTAFIQGKPDLAQHIGHTLRVIEASDDATVASYGAALEQYNQTGDPSALHVVAETFAQDSITLALRNGEMTPEDARDPALLSSALGFSPGMSDAAAGQAINPMPVAQAAPTAVAPQPATSVRASFSGKDAAPGASVQSQFQGERRAALSRATMRQPAATGEGQAIVKGWTPSDTYG